jgi:2-polyprenyl-3-methyl-5-hydroxy-6-metoxy-1,4-benzoquinol methylase
MISLNDFYDEEYYDGGKGYHRYSDSNSFAFLAARINEIMQPKSVLDIGCAKGFLVKAFRSMDIPAYGIDISHYALEEAPKEVKKYLKHYDITSGFEITIPKVDLIVSIDTLEHIPEEKLDRVKDFMLAHSQRQFLRVGTLATPDWQHDASHITMKTIDWWQEWLPTAEWEESL